MATYNVASLPSSFVIGDIINCPYSSTYKTITLPKGIYKLECWGAQGGSYNTTCVGGKGGYSVGTITLTKDETFYLYTGGQGQKASSSATGILTGGFNGGGDSNANTSYYVCSGGGSSDIRIGQSSLYARVIVAGGGGGASYAKSAFNGGYGGGTAGGAGTDYSTSYRGGAGGTATAAGNSYYGTTANSTTYGTLASFGQGGSAISSYVQVAGGGGGWYGGGYSRRGAGGGGSGYVYTSATASQYPSGCTLNSSYYLTDASTKAGDTSFTDYSGSTVTGHEGNGAIRITVLQVGLQITDIYLKIGENNWKKLFDLTSKKPPVIPVTINLTITSSTVIVNGTTYTASTNIETVNPVNIIFTLQGNLYMGQGTVNLNGTTIYTTNITGTGSETFTWTPTESYSTITINCQTTTTWYASTKVTITTT